MPDREHHIGYTSGQQETGSPVDYELARHSESYCSQVLSNWGIAPNSAVLDFGSGLGNESKYLRKSLLARVVESDVHASQPAGKIDVEYLDLLTTELAKTGMEFDAVHAKDVLVHISDKEEFFRILSGVLKPKGKLLIVSQERHQNSFYYKQTGMNQRPIWKEQAFSNLYKYQELVNNLWRANLSPQATVRTDIITPPFYQTTKQDVAGLARANHFNVAATNEAMPDHWRPESGSDERNWTEQPRFVLSLERK
jgi:2-polyprenyl-3-methyl-5-hydroxy-6-metoxy-1,4-benzoquinol methylase